MAAGDGQWQCAMAMGNGNAQWAMATYGRWAMAMGNGNVYYFEH